MKTSQNIQTSFDRDLLTEEFITPDPVRDDERTAEVKEAILSLSEAERNLVLLYLDKGSYSKAAKEIFISTSLYYLRMKEIKEKINKHIERCRHC